MSAPASLFTTDTGRPVDATALDRTDRSTDDWISRKVTAVGVITVARQQISVGRHRATHIVDVHVGVDLLHVWDGSELIKTAIRDNQKEVRKKNAATG